MTKPGGSESGDGRTRGWTARRIRACYVFEASPGPAEQAVGPPQVRPTISLLQTPWIYCNIA